MEILILLAAGAAALWYLRGAGGTRSAAPAASPDGSAATPQSSGGSSAPVGPPAPTPSWRQADVIALIYQMAQELDYPRPELVRAIAGVESSLKPRSINRSDRPPSVGLMGLKVPTARYYVPWVETEEQLFDPFTNLRAGIMFLHDLERKWLETYQLEGVIQMYNLGETRFRAGERSPEYLAAVTARLQAIRS